MKVAMTLSTGLPVLAANVPQKSSARAFEYLNLSI